MRKVVLYIAMSLDGFIADKNGGVDWLKGQDESASNDGSYPAFIQTVDTVIMGYTTYNQIVTELSPDKWFYEGMDTYVMTHRPCSDEEEIYFTDENLKSLIQRLQMKKGKDIWICGGADIVNQLIKEDIIDRYHITVIPEILGDGVGLFDRGNEPILLELILTENYNGMTDLVYERRK